MNLTAQALMKRSQIKNEEAPISTNLYELVKAISDEVSSGKDELIATVLIDLNNRGSIRMGPKMRRYLSQYN